MYSSPDREVVAHKLDSLAAQVDAHHRSSLLSRPSAHFGIEVLAPVHDAFLVGGPASEIEKIARRTEDCIDRASNLVLRFAMRADVKIIKYPDRFLDPRGAETWKSKPNPKFTPIPSTVDFVPRSAALLNALSLRFIVGDQGR